MVDLRPLLFVNALAIMLLVTAGFARIQDMYGSPSPAVATPAAPQSSERQIPVTPATRPSAREPIFADEVAAEIPEAPVRPSQSEPLITDNPINAETADPFVPPPPGDSKAGQQFDADESQEPETVAIPPMVADAEVPVAPTKQPLVPPTPPAPTTGQLTLRSNVVGDAVTINGTSYGATRLDLNRDPGQYDIQVSKDGFRSWSQQVSISAGDELTLVARLEAYTRVNFQHGKWVGGIRTGDGQYLDGQGLRYEGHFVSGQFQGEGTAWYPDGSRYEGEWHEGQRQGEGTFRSADDSRYIGQFRSDRFHGQGTLTRASGDVLTGNWADGQLNGRGSLSTADGMLYVGGFHNGRFHGEGTLTYPDGRHYEGGFSNGNYHGKGSEILANGKKYRGQYIDGQYHGEGLLLNPNGSSIEATFRHGEPYGQVRLTTATGEVFTARTTEPGICYREKSYRATECPTLEGW